MLDINLKILLTFYLFLLTLGTSLTYAQSPDNILTKKELRQQKKDLRQRQKRDKRQAKEQLSLIADSIKISAMLQLRNSHEAEQVDSLKRVMKNAKQLAKEAILEQEQEQAINIAETERNKKIPETRGKAEQEISKAQGYALEIVNRAKGDAERFTQILEEYKKAPEITRTRLYLDVMGKLLKRSQAVTIIDPKISGVLPIYTAKGLSGKNQGAR